MSTNAYRIHNALMFLHSVGVFVAKFTAFVCILCHPITSAHSAVLKYTQPAHYEE